MDILVQDYLEHNSIAYPDKIALVCNGKRFRYCEINLMANRLANALIDHGITRGDRVVVNDHNSLETAVSIFAILKAGGVFVVVNPTIKKNKLTYILNNCRAKALITGSKKTSIYASIINKISSLIYCVHCGDQVTDVMNSAMQCQSFADIQIQYSDKNPPRKNIDLDFACLIYTSGSTGDPKAVICDHDNINFVTSSIISYLENVENDIILNVLPLSFDYGLYQLLMTFKFGGTLVLERSFLYPSIVLQQIQDEGVTGFPGVPSIFAILMRMNLNHYDLSSIRYVTNTAAVLTPRQIEQLRDVFPKAALYSMYGLTETKRTLFMPPCELDAHPNSVGIAIPGTEVWIEDECGSRLRPGEIGRIGGAGATCYARILGKSGGYKKNFSPW